MGRFAVAMHARMLMATNSSPAPAPEKLPSASGVFQPPSLEELNERIPAYEFLEFLDRGGMGVVYRARQRSLDRIVAIKLLLMEMSHRKAFSDRFKREARALALLNHPHIVSIYDFGEAPGGYLYYVMEYVKGTNLRQLMRAGQTTSRKLLTIAMQVCEALQFAHGNGVVHRDVKPANVLIDERGHVKVADFGLSKVIGPSPAQLTAASDAMGTPDYMAPETITHEHEVDHRADVYSLGVMLYEMLTGHVPRGAWQPPSCEAGTDARFDDVVNRALQNDPQKRFQNIGELTHVMKQLVQVSHTPTPFSPVALDRVPAVLDAGASTMAMRRPRRAARLPRLAWIAIIAACLGGVSFGYFKNQAYFQKMFGMAPAEPPAPAEMSPREKQAVLARYVINHGGFVNVVTPFQQERRMGSEGGDIYDLSELPKGEFSVWRVSLDDRAFTDEALAGLVRRCEAAGTVTNVNLHGSGVTAKGMSMLLRINDMLDSLKLTETEAFSAESLPYLAACKRMRLLIVSASVPGDGTSDVKTTLELAETLRGILPNCDIRVD
jgi:predicted Ser/Thr protein kinase